MWNDANKDILDILSYVIEKCSLPYQCPVCRKQSAHIYMYRWKQDKKGSIWTWCSNCKASAHERMDLPDWWRNSAVLDDNLLGVHPDMLDENRKFVDAYFNMLLHGEYPDTIIQKTLKNRYSQL